MTRPGIFLLALLNAAIGISQCQLPNTTIVYDLYARGHHLGEITRVTDFYHHKYKIDVNTKARFLFFSDRIDEQSRGDVLAAGIRPSIYSLTDAHKGMLASVRFDWRKNIGISEFKGLRVELPIRMPIYDNLSYQLPLRCALEDGRTKMNYSVLYENHIQRYEAVVLKEHAKISTPLGAMDAVEVKETTLGQHVGINILWFARAHHFALVESAAISGSKRQALAIVKKIS